jgi:putative hydrolase of the HAD superfamily
MATIKAVLFDYGRVLSGPPDPAAREEMKQILGVDEERFPRDLLEAPR